MILLSSLGGNGFLLHPDHDTAGKLLKNYNI